MGGNWGNQQDEMHSRRPWWFDIYCIYRYFRTMLGISVVAFALALSAPSPASAFCFKEIGGVFHKPKVEQPVPGAYPAQIRPAGSQAKPQSFCETVMRASAVTIVVQGIVVGIKVGLAVFTGVLIL